MAVGQAVVEVNAQVLVQPTGVQDEGAVLVDVGL